MKANRFEQFSLLSNYVEAIDQERRMFRTWKMIADAGNDAGLWSVTPGGLRMALDRIKKAVAAGKNDLPPQLPLPFAARLQPTPQDQPQQQPAAQVAPSVKLGGKDAASIGSPIQIHSQPKAAAPCRPTRKSRPDVEIQDAGTELERAMRSSADAQKC